MAEYKWILLDQNRKALGATEPFPSQEAAEAWMGTEWSSLLEEGAEKVRLVDPSGKVLYTMGLREE
jgi:hypothetical protein